MYAKDSWILDDELGYRLADNLDYPLQTQEFNVRLTTNEDGIRDEIQEKYYTILAIGDSFTMGVGVESNETYAHHLETFIAQDNIATEVINLGVPGYGTVQEQLYLQRMISRFQPETIILGLLIDNDIRNDAIFATTHYSLVDGYLVQGDPPKNTLIQRIRVFLNTHVYTWVWLKRTLVQIDFIRNFRRSLNKNFDPANDNALLTFGWNITQQTLLNIKHIAETHHANFIVVLIPEKNILEHKTPKETYTFVHAFLQNNSIPTLDALTLFENTPDPLSYYFEIDGHWNAKAHKLVAEHLYSSFFS